MIDNSVLELDDKKYLVVDTIIIDDTKYVYFANEKDYSDFIVQKEIEENEKRYLVNLDNNEEFDKVMSLFGEKHQ